eukprot:m.16582 g.16582  ORF g.16582 m.16582 type:complete len:177 (-) comp5735_c0_seq1:50-580(-)
MPMDAHEHRLNYCEDGSGLPKDIEKDSPRLSEEESLKSLEKQFKTAVAITESNHDNNSNSRSDSNSQPPQSPSQSKGSTAVYETSQAELAQKRKRPASPVSSPSKRPSFSQPVSEPMITSNSSPGLESIQSASDCIDYSTEYPLGHTYVGAVGMQTAEPLDGVYEQKPESRMKNFL